MTPTYTPNQLESYLQRIGYADSLPQEECPRLQQLHQAIQEDALDALAELQRRHLGSISWGNSALHYSQHHSVSIHSSAVFDKLVNRRLDGYCMENTSLLYVVLRSLGYQVYPSAGRVSQALLDPAAEQNTFLALNHMVLIVTIHDQKYMVDVGFGNNVPTSPLPLIENVVANNIAPAEMRLIKDPLPESVDRTQKAWIYQVRYNPQSDWITLYAFSGMEFLMQDFAMINFAVSREPASWFTQALVCVKLILDETGSELQGLYILADKEVKKRVCGSTEVVETLENEEDRVNALAKWFGIHLFDYEVAGIRGLGSQLK